MGAIRSMCRLGPHCVRIMPRHGPTEAKGGVLGLLGRSAPARTRPLLGGPRTAIARSAGTGGSKGRDAETSFRDDFFRVCGLLTLSWEAKGSNPPILRQG